ncbi:MAG: esterase [Nitrospirales bacterium]|nr:MAG: esterase [Nitrospirales bacterium]
MKHVTIAGLDVRITGGPDREGGGTGPVVLLLHGFGAPGDDLVPLWQVLDVPAETRFIFPAAPLSLDMGFGDSRAWWMLDMERLAQTRAKGNWAQLIKEVPKGLSEAREKVMSVIQVVNNDFHVASEKLIIGGFSQGSMLACDIVLRSDQQFAGVVLLSSSLIAKDEWAPLMVRRKGTPVFQSHGTDDPILSPEVAQQLGDMLQAEGLSVEWHAFRGGHEIPMNILERLGGFIKRVLYKSTDDY